MKEDKTQGAHGDIRNIEIRVVQILYHFIKTYFPEKVKVMAPKNRFWDTKTYPSLKKRRGKCILTTVKIFN